MGRHAEQAILKRLAEPRIHGQRNHQRGDARGHAHDGHQRNQAQHGRAVGGQQVALGYEPFESHCRRKNTLRAVRFGSAI